MSPRIKPVAILPTLCTLGNTFCGFLAISKVADALLVPAHFRENVVFAAWMIFLAMVFDALDGRIARLTNQASDFGAQMDSLTDLITFGVAPAFLVKVIYDHTFTGRALPFETKVPLLLAVIYVVCATLRLARFTLETEPDPKAHEVFKGLPSPAAAGTLAASVFLLFEKNSPLADVSAQTHLNLVKGLIALPVVLGLLMVSRVEYVHLVSRWFRGRKPFMHLLLVLTLVFLAVTWHEVVFFLAFAGYAVAGPLMVVAERTTGKRLFAPGDDEDEDDGAHGLGRRERALVAIGSNLGDRESHVAYAVDQLKLLPETRVLGVSAVRETDPVGGPPQRKFLNAVALLDTGLGPEVLMARLLQIERERGRERTVRDGPRTLDLDLVLYGSTICETQSLTLPHPRFRERRFVLEAAADVAPGMVDPVTNRSIRALLDEPLDQPA